MEDRHNHNHNQPPSNGFLMGVIIGGVATLIFTTKKGREIVKDLADKGLEKYYEFEKKLEDTKEDYEEIIEGEDYIAPVESEKVKLAKESKQEKISTVKEDKAASAKTKVKRYFRLNKN